MASQSRPEPMNASPHHSKVKVTLALSDPVYVSGTPISGKMEVESRADLDSLLGIGVMMVELHAAQEINSGAHSATSTFIHSRRIFQGPGLPPSNAVYSDHAPSPDELPLPAHHYAARRGQTTFFFQFPVPESSPSSINFGPASIRYEIRASVSVAWRGENCLVTDKREVKVVESRDPTQATQTPQAVVITEGGKICAQATLTNSVVVGGEYACIDLQLKNHTQRWTSGVTVALKRDLHLSTSFLAGRSPPNFSDVATQVEFRGPEYSVPPGIEGIARLVINIPRHSRGVKGGLRVDDNGSVTEGFFEVRCTLRIRIDMPPGSEDTVIILPLTIYHSLAVPEIPASPPRLTSSYSYPASVSPGLLSPPPGTELIPAYSGNQIQQYDPAWLAPFSNSSPIQHPEQETHNWQDVPYSYPLPMQRSISVGPPSQVPYLAPGLSTSYAPSPRMPPPPPPTHVPHIRYIHPGLPVETIDGYTSHDHIQGAIVPPTSQNVHPATQYHPLSPNLSSQSHSQDQPLTPGRTCPPPIQIPPLPNPHDSQGTVHSPRPVPSPKHSFSGSVPKSNNVTELERMADEVGKQTDNLSLDLPKGDVGVKIQGPQGPKLDRQPNFSVDKTLPPPPVPSSKDRHLFAQHPRVDTLFTTEGTMLDHHHPGSPSSTDHLPRAPPTPPIAAITPIKFPKAPTELSGLGANLGKTVPPESGLDALERRLLAEVGTRRFVVEERPHVRSVVQPITIPPSGPPPDTVNDSAISSLTLADREGILKANPEREQEQDRDSDERTQHMGGGRRSPSEDDRDARTQKGKSSRKLGKSKHSEEDLERASRRRERKKTKDEEGRKLRQEAKGRVAAWLGDIDISASPAMDDTAALISPTSHFVPITESASFTSAPVEMTDKESEEHRRGDVATDKDVSASPNPRSSGFVTISSLDAVVVTDGSGGETSSFKPSLRRFSANDFHQIPQSSDDQPMATRRLPMSRSPSAEVKRSQPLDTPLQTQPSKPQPQLSPAQLPRLSPGRLPRFSFKLTDPEVKYDVRSARGGKGGKVTQVASIWATKANAANTNANANAKGGDTTPVPPAVPKKLTSPPPVRKPALNVPRRSPVSMRLPPRIGATGGGGMPPVGLNRIGGETRTGIGLGTREAPRATKATTVPAVLSSSHAIPMLSSTASLARVKGHGPGQGLGQGQARSLPPMISETISDLRSVSRGGGGAKTSVTGAANGGAGGGGPGRTLGDLAFGQARLRDLIKKYQG
ncbi:hypothetical protein JVT61DRAFT_7992 [Boletus reticuloceps]|uniref:Arrestin-like N-terminal domain-containing protein n=1 Tax=Boletus reticuloceps TaxID=495285 RepID=A0A8I2YHF6_9AGAM|nr:hypothetical protein JVT61DRAFT_7992 [Boletus reticuloceps]